jgi:predicted glycoside hydrolase/deacetylase ChbG (UPF0249 family)
LPVTFYFFMSYNKLLLCINADDFGFSSNISAGILLLMEQGIVTSTSVMPLHCTSNDFEKLANTKNISVGLHFSLTSSCNHFINNIQSPYTLAQKVLIKQLTKEAIYKELLHQYLTLKKNFSGNISHIDTHQHIHILPIVKKIIQTFARENRIPFVRTTKEISPLMSMKKIIYNLSNTDKSIPVFGLNLMGKNFSKENILKHLHYLRKKQIRKAIWIVHPGYVTNSKEFQDSYNTQREHELKILMDIKNDILKYADIVPLTHLL